jgi:hypothetical protein
MKLCYVKITIELVKTSLVMSIPSHTPYWGLYEHLPHSKTPQNMKKWKVQSERVFKCDHLGQSTTVTFILLSLVEGTVLGQIYRPKLSLTLFHCSTESKASLLLWVEML